MANDFIGRIAAAAGWPGAEGQGNTPAALSNSGTVGSYSASPAPGAQAGEGKTSRSQLFDGSSQRSALRIDTPIHPDDPRSKLPKAAIEKLDQLNEIRFDAHTLYIALTEERDKLRAELALQQRTLREFRGEEGNFRKADDRSIAIQQNKLNTVKGNLQKVETRQAELSKKMNGCGHHARAIEDYMERVREPLKPAPEPKYAKSLSLDKAIESVLDLRADRHRVRSSPRPSTEAKEAAAQYVNRLADTGMPDVGPCLDHGEDPRWPTRFERVEEPEGLAQSRSLSEYRSYSVSTVALLPTLAWLHRDALIERLHQEIDMCATDEDALSLPEREKREAELAAAILDAERTVAAIAWQAETPWLIPHDIDPRAVLGVTGPEPRG